MHRTSLWCTISALTLTAWTAANAAPEASKPGRSGSATAYGYTHLPDSLPPSVEVKEGVLYLGGNRMAGNLLLTASDSGLVVNGFRVYPVRKPRGHLSLLTNGDLIRSEMSEQARSIAESARKKSLPPDETLRLIRDHFRSYRLVASAEISGNAILLRYRDTEIRHSWELSDPIDPERMRLADRWSALRRLDELKGHLDQGGLVVAPSLFLPAHMSLKVDEAIQRLQDGLATSSDKKVLKQSRLNGLEELKHPLALHPVRTRLYPDGPVPRSLVVENGVLYVGGHRQSGPIQLVSTDSGLVVNGLRNVPLARPSPDAPMSHGDSVRTSLNDQARRIAENGRERGLPQSEILSLVRNFFIQESTVSSVEIRGHWVVVTYVDAPHKTWLELEALRRRSARPAGQEWARFYELKRIEGHLEEGGVVLYSRRGIVYLSSQKSPEFDRLIQRLQAGDATPGEERTLRGFIHQQPFEELRHPIPLEELRCP